MKLLWRCGIWLFFFFLLSFNGTVEDELLWRHSFEVWVLFFVCICLTALYIDIEWKGYDHIDRFSLATYICRQPVLHLFYGLKFDIYQKAVFHVVVGYIVDDYYLTAMAGIINDGCDFRNFGAPSHISEFWKTYSGSILCSILQLYYNPNCSLNRISSILCARLNYIHEKVWHTRWFQFLSLWPFHLYVSSFKQHLHMNYISLSWVQAPICISSEGSYCTNHLLVVTLMLSLQKAKWPWLYSQTCI